jgi:RNA polymerase sigma-70 factor (ECF subfamily)
MSKSVRDRRYLAVLIPVENRASIDELFTAHYTGLARVIYRVTGDTAAAEELAAEAFWKLHRRPPASHANLVGWLYRTALRLALDSLKMRKRRTRYESEAARAATPGNPEEAAERLERERRVREVLGAIKPEQAALLVLRGEGHTLAEIADLLYLNPGSAGTFVARAEAAFRKEYVDRYGEDGIRS